MTGKDIGLLKQVFLPGSRFHKRLPVFMLPTSHPLKYFPVEYEY